MSACAWPLQVGILAFDEVEALDLAGPYEVFTTATRVARRDAPDHPPLFDVHCVARERQPVRARAGMTLLPAHAFATAPALDVLVVPGGAVDAAMCCHDTLAWIRHADQDTTITASVCTGAFLLAASGVLTHGAATTHWEDAEALARQFPSLQVQHGPRWIDQGHIVTSGGISAGIDMSLHLVARLAGQQVAQQTARQMEFEWTRV